VRHDLPVECSWYIWVVRPYYGGSREFDCYPMTAPKICSPLSFNMSTSFPSNLSWQPTPHRHFQGIHRSDHLKRIHPMRPPLKAQSSPSGLMEGLLNYYQLSLSIQLHLLTDSYAEIWESGMKPLTSQRVNTPVDCTERSVSKSVCDNWWLLVEISTSELTISGNLED